MTDTEKAKRTDRDDHEAWCCVDHPGTKCDDQCPACGGPLDIDNERCTCGYDARRPDFTQMNRAHADYLDHARPAPFLHGRDGES